MKSTVTGCVLLVWGGTTEAIPIISVDADPATAGIQSVLTVDQGATFTVDIVISDDGLMPTPTVFDTVILELSYNDAGAVLEAGPTGPIGGVLAGNSPLTFDIFSGAFAAAGSPLTLVPASPSPGYSNSSGAVGLLDPLTFTVLPGAAVTIFNFDFTALAVGSTSILAAGSPPGSPVLALAGFPVASILEQAGITVQSNGQQVPEPGVFVLLGIGLGGLTYQRRRLMVLESNRKRLETP